MFNTLDVPYLKAVQVATPAAGAEFVITGPGQGIWRVIALRAVLTTSATVATRIPGLTYGTSDGLVGHTAGLGTVAASLAASWSGFAGSPNTAGAGVVHQWAVPTDGYLLLPGWTLSSLTAAIDATDQWSLVRALVVEYPTGPDKRLTPDVAYFTETKG